MLRTRIATLAFTLAAGTLAVAAAPVFLRQGPVEPTQEHAHILSGVGTWEGTLTNFVPGMPTDPVPAKETIVGIGDLWTQSTFECEFMGMPYKGTGCIGFDPDKKKFIGTWIDNTSTHLAIMEGEIDKSGKKLIMRWQAPDMMTGAMAPHRYEAVHSKDAMTSTFYMGEGEGMKTMVIDMKRKGGAPVEAGAGR